MVRSFILLFFLSFIYGQILSQINDTEAPYVLTIDQLKSWSQSGDTADPSLIATEPLANRFINTQTQLNPSLSNDLEIAYLPGGMNNFGNYSVEQDVFNLYNFTHWAYIDRLIWFGGTADLNVLVPSAPWTNTAHKNGVKVLGNIFFAPIFFGGTTAILNNFLEKDSNGNFIVVPRLVDMMQYYNFDGWFINQETDTDPAVAQLMYEFMVQLTAAVEANGKEVMWYDAMRLDGAVGWQNRLNTVNSPFVQNDQDANPANGFETRVSSNIFINFFWDEGFPNDSRSRAQTIGRSEFDVFTGVDLWPRRNQANFETGGNVWMEDIHQNATTAYTSLGLFAPSCVYNNPQYSTFNTDPSDFEAFYSEERHMFAGSNRNPAIEDTNGFKGFSHWIPAASTIVKLPFETNFNTGHGLKKFENGIEVSNSPWHDMNVQDILPTWQFAFSDTAFSGAWDFETAYHGGSSLDIHGDLRANTPIDLKLYKTNITITQNSVIDVVYKYDSASNSEIKLILSLSGMSASDIERDISPGSDDNNGDWILKTVSIGDLQGQELNAVGIRFESSENIQNYTIKMGRLKLYEDFVLNIADNSNSIHPVSLVYSPDSNSVILSTSSKNSMDFDISTLHGQTISKHRFDFSRGDYNLDTNGLAKGMYILKFSDQKQQQFIKKLIVR